MITSSLYVLCVLILRFCTVKYNKSYPFVLYSWRGPTPNYTSLILMSSWRAGRSVLFTAIRIVQIHCGALHWMQWWEQKNWRQNWCQTIWRVDLGDIFIYNSNDLNSFSSSSLDSIIALQSRLSLLSGKHFWRTHCDCFEFCGEARLLWRLSAWGTENSSGSNNDVSCCLLSFGRWTSRRVLIFLNRESRV